MSRAIDADFALLQGFLNSYSLNAAATKPEQLRIIKAAHRAYLPFLQLWSICADEARKGGLSLYGKPVEEGDLEFSFLRETVSDTGSGFFCCLHGAYKPGHMALRSSIENFLRFSAGIFDKKALTTTSVYELFDIARDTESFSGERCGQLNKLRSNYVELCGFSHSASLSHMAGIHALAHFPSFDEKAFETWIRLAKSCMSAIATVTIQGHPALYFDAHFVTKELLDELVPQSERLDLLRAKAAFS